MNQDSTKALISGLLSDGSDRERYRFAVKLMRIEEPEVKQAYIQALSDSSDRVAQIACLQLSWRGRTEAEKALYRVLEHPSWRVRLEACKAFIVLKAVNRQVVAALEQMAQEPEAAEYNAQIEMFDSIMVDANLDNELEMWGRIDTILEQARRIVNEQD
jgi:hypothetical protein